MNDPELKAMAAVYDALQGLDGDTQKRVTDWVLNKLKSTSTAAPAKKTGKKRGRKPGAKKAAAAAAAVSAPGAKKRGRPAGSGKKKAAKKAGKRGRPAGSGKKAAKKVATKSTGKRRGRPRKNPVAPVAAA